MEKTKSNRGRKSIPPGDKKIATGILVKAKNLKKLQPILRVVVRNLDN